MEKFRNKYRIPSTRWQNWDYGSNAAYYVTLCTQHHVCYFGDIVLVPEKTMQFNQIGSIAHQYWCEIPNHFPFIELDEFVVMPHHVHGIVVINKTGNVRPVETRLIASLQTTPQIAPQTVPQSIPQIISKSNATGGVTGIKNPMIHENLSRVIRWYKGRCSFEIRKIAGDFTWQSRFHDHIIRNYIEYEAIRDYIIHNIENWKEDSLMDDDLQ